VKHLPRQKECFVQAIVLRIIVIKVLIKSRQHANGLASIVLFVLVVGIPHHAGGMNDKVLHLTINASQVQSSRNSTADMDVC